VGFEEALYAENEAFAERLKEVGVDAQIRFYGKGTHSWPYWERELGVAWSMLTEPWAHGAAALSGDPSPAAIRSTIGRSGTRGRANGIEARGGLESGTAAHDALGV